MPENSEGTSGPMKRMNGVTNPGRTADETTGLTNPGQIADEMTDDFRGVLADVLDGRSWAGYAGPGAVVRRRGQKRRRRVAATSVASVAVVAAAVATTTAGLATGGPGTSTTALSTGRPTTPGHGQYVKLSEALMQPADLGTGFTNAGTNGAGEGFPGLMCSPITPAAIVGQALQREFSGPGPDGHGLSNSEFLYQFTDAPAAKAAFAKARSAAQAGGCKDGAGSVSSVHDVDGVGDATFVQENYGGPTMVSFAVVLDGPIVIVDELLLGSAEQVKAVSGSWLTGVSQKAVTRLRDAPRTDAPEPVPTAAQPVGGSPGTAPSSVGVGATPKPFPVSQPVDGFLFAPQDLGKSFGADAQDAWQSGQGQIATATSVSGMMFRGSVSGGDGEFLVNEGVYSFADAAAAQTGLAAYGRSTTQTAAKAEPLSGLGDQAWIKHWAGQQGGRTVAIRVGAKVITFDVLAGGTSADQPIPGGDAWVQQIAQKAVQRLAGAK